MYLCPLGGGGAERNGGPPSPATNMESITSPPTPASGVMQVVRSPSSQYLLSHLHFCHILSKDNVSGRILDVNLDTELGQNPLIVGKHLRKILISIEDRSLFA